MDESERIFPFPGLRPFGTDEAHLFFGREGQSTELLSLLREHRFLAVLGSSGSGKSSLVLAGLLPSLYGGFMRGAGSHWRIALMRPGTEPISKLAGVLADPSVLGGDEDVDPELQATLIEATLRRGSLGLVEAIDEARLPERDNVLVVVDQFEEIFRFQAISADTEFGDDAAAFVKLLLEAGSAPDTSTYVLLTMRSDYLGDCAQFRDLPEAINRGKYLIPRMTREQRRLAIEGPVAVGGGSIAPRLVNRMLNDMGSDPDQLPILQHAAMQTWKCWTEDESPDEPLDLQHYEAIGGMERALSLHADKAYDELPSERSREVAEKMFRRLTEKGADNREIRRPTRFRELCAVSGAPEDEVKAVIETFRLPGRSFLMPAAGTELGADSLIDISHESLIRGWDRLATWVEEEAESAKVYRRLAETAALWKHDRAGLWRDPDLQLALDWWERDHPNAAWAAVYDTDFESARKFLDRSRKARDAAAEARKRQLRIVIAALAFGFVGASALALWALDSRAEAERSLDLAEFQTQRARAAERNVRSQDFEFRWGTASDALDRLMRKSSDEHPLESVTLNEQRARNYAYTARWDSAIAAYSAALRINPNDLGALVNRSDIYLNAGEPEKARADLEYVLERKPNYFLAHVNMAVVLGQLGNYDAARHHFRRAIESTAYAVNQTGQPMVSPDLERVMGVRSLSLSGNEARTAYPYGLASTFAFEGGPEAGGAFEAALAAADSLAAADGQSSVSQDAIVNAMNWAWLHRDYLKADYGAHVAEGALWTRAGATSTGELTEVVRAEAARSFCRFLTEHESRGDSRYDDLAAWVDDQNASPSLRGCGGLEMEPAKATEDVQTLIVEAAEFRVRGEPERRDSVLSLALAHEPRNTEVILGRADARRVLAEAIESRAEEDSTRAESTSADSVKVLRASAKARYDSAAVWFDSAMVDADRALEISARLAQAYYVRGRVKFSRATPDDLRDTSAVHDIAAEFDRALEYDPSHADAHYYRALTLWRTDWREAALSHRKVLEIAPHIDGLWQDLAVADYSLGRYPEAKRAIEIAIAMRPERLSHYDDRAVVDSALGRDRALIEKERAEGYAAAAEEYRELGNEQGAANALTKSAALILGRASQSTRELARRVRAEASRVGRSLMAIGDRKASEQDFFEATNEYWRAALLSTAADQLADGRNAPAGRQPSEEMRLALEAMLDAQNNHLGAEEASAFFRRFLAPGGRLESLVPSGVLRERMRAVLAAAVNRRSAG